MVLHKLLSRHRPDPVEQHVENGLRDHECEIEQVLVSKGAAVAA